MTASTAKAETTNSGPVDSKPMERSSVDVFKRLAELAGQGTSPRSFYRAAIHVIANHSRARFAAINICNTAETLDEQVTDRPVESKIWERVVHGAILDSQTSGNAVARLYDIDGTTKRVAVLSVALRDDSQNSGAMALVVACENRSAAESELFELRSLATLTCSLASASQRLHRQEVGSSETIQRAVEKASRYHSLAELAFAITNGLKTKYECEQVVLGQVVGKKVRILSLSGMDTTYPRSPGSRLISQAMEECLDNGAAIVSQANGQWNDKRQSGEFRLHRQWRAAIGDASVVSIPLFAGEQCVAVVSLARPGGSGFQNGELEELQKSVGAFGPALQLVARASRSWLAQTRDTLRDGIVWAISGSQWGRKVAAVAVLGVACWFFMGSVDYRISVPCQIAASQVQYCGAPFEGVIASAHVDVGDHVIAGQLLFSMDTRDLELRQAELESELAVAKLEVSRAISGRALQDAALAQAQARVVWSRLASVARRLQLAEFRAPSNGVIMAGDLEKRIGEMVALGDPLLEFSPQASWEIELRINERDAGNIRVGQTGRFATNARPDKVIDCTLERIDPMASVADGSNVFVARAGVTENPQWMLSGMDGVAVVDTGRRPVWWVALHRVIRFARLHFWL